MKVLKFGGSSIASSERIYKVLDIIKDASKQQKIAVVFSAIKNTTDQLVDISQKAKEQDDQYLDKLKELETLHLNIVRDLVDINYQSGVLSGVKKRFNQLENLLEGVYLLKELSKKTHDVIISHGELFSSFIITKALQTQDENAIYKDSTELIITNSKFGSANPNNDITNMNIAKFFANNPAQITVLPGFIAKDNSGNITTLGRGGSDFTAALIAGGAKANILEIWTDVSGMYSVNPNFVRHASPIEQLSYSEAMELSHFGASVLYPPTVQPVMEKNIPLYIKNTFRPEDEGTLVSNKKAEGHNIVRGISHIDNVSLITIEGSGLIGVPGFSKRLFKALSEKDINIVLITQASSERSICCAIETNDVFHAENAVNQEFAYEISLGKINKLSFETDLAIVAIVGEGMRNHQGVSGRMFSALGKNNVNIRAIAQGSSERNISTVIEKRHIKKALNSLHAEFFESHITRLNLFVTGIGNVGGKLLEQIESQHDYLIEKLKLRIEVVGISNSSRMIFNEDGVDLKNWKQLLLESDVVANPKLFFQKAKELNLRNSIFVDNTASDKIAGLYEHYLRESIGVVTCNKIACSSEYEIYDRLKHLSQEYNAPFFFETNVGAGLPIINTLNNLIQSGDEIKKIQAVASGSLNYVFNNFVEDANFYDVVLKAKELGFTEPDPRIDLSGVDVARKILILARESGAILNLENIKNVSFLPENSLAADSVDDFLNSLTEEAKHFEALKSKAAANNTRLKYVAEYADGNANVSLQEVPEGHPFYNLEGSDNIVLFFTKRYPEQPLIVKGAGAGADVTASGIFADIIRIGRG